MNQFLKQLFTFCFLVSSTFAFSQDLDFDLEKNISPEDLDLFNIVQTPMEAVEIIEEFYSKYTLKPNF